MKINFRYLSAGRASVLVSTERGVGWWDEAHAELRLPVGVHVSPRPRQMRPATETEATLYYSIKHETRRQLCEYYNGRGRHFSGD